MQYKLKNKSLIILPLLFVSMLAYLPGSFHTASATLTGNVCLQPSGTVGCPGAPVLFASSGGTLMVAVNIVGSDPLNGFDVSIKTDSTVLAASGADLTGTIVTSASVVLKCFDGVLVTGSACASQDGLGVLHFAATKTGATVSGNGLLFTAVYSVVAATPGISVGFAVDATDCASTSVAGGVCVSISNGTSTPLSETTTGATFSNLSDFGIAVSACTNAPTSIHVAPTVVGTCVVTLSSFGGWTDFIDLTTTPSAGLTASTAGTTLLLPADGSVSTMLSASAPVSGSYSALVSASADQILGTCSPCTAITHTVTVPVIVAPQDFTISASPTTLNIPPGGSGTSTITVGSISGFSGNVSLTATVSPAGPTGSLSPTSVTAPGTSTLTVTVPGGTAPGMYTVTVTGTGSGSHSVAITVNVGTPDFSLTASPNVLNIPRFNPLRTGGSSINIGSVNNFAATLTLTMSISGPVAQISGDIPGAALTAILTKTSITLSSGGHDTSDLIMTVLKASTGTGLHTVTVTVSGGGKTHTVQVLDYVTDFTMTLRDPVVTLINDSPTILAHPVQTVMRVRAIGAPNQTVSLGFDIAAPAPLLNSAYTYSPSRGRLFLQLPLSDASRRRCFMAVFDSLNNLITPTLTGSGAVSSFLAPLVHINGDADGDPPTFNGCRFDSGDGPSFFGTGPSPGVNTGDPPVDAFPMPTIEILPNTPNGMYTAQVCYLGGIVLNCVPWQINLVPPPLPPSFNQFLWKSHKISLASGTVESFVVGVNNNATNGCCVPNPTLFVQVIIVAVDSGGNTATATSGVIEAPAGHNTNNIHIDMDVSGLSGVVHFSGTIQYGVAPAFLTENSAANLGSASKDTGSFFVGP